MGCGIFFGGSRLYAVKGLQRAIRVQQLLHSWIRQHDSLGNNTTLAMAIGFCNHPVTMLKSLSSPGCFVYYKLRDQCQSLINTGLQNLLHVLLKSKFFQAILLTAKLPPELSSNFYIAPNSSFALTGSSNSTFFMKE